MESRRTLIMGIGATTLGLMTPSSFARPQNEQPRGHPEFERNRFSQAVAEGVFSAFSDVMANASDSTQLQVASHAWKVARGHFNETGLFPTGDELLRTSDINEVLAAAATMPQQIVSIAEKHGVRLQLERLQVRVAALTPDRVAEAITSLQTAGTAVAFDRVAQVFDKIRKGRTPRGAGPFVIEPNDELCTGLAAIEATMWILAGLYSLGCAVTLGACVPCCVAAAVLAIAAGVLDLIGVYYC